MLTQEQVNVLMAALMRSDGFAKRAAVWLKRDHIDRFAESPMLGVIWEALAHFATVDEIKRIPSLEELRVLMPMLVETHIETFGGDKTELLNYGLSFLDDVARCDSDMVEFAAPIAKHAYSFLVEGEEMQRAFYEAQASGDWEAVRKAALKFEAEKSAISEKISSDPLSNLDKLDDLIGDEPPPTTSRLITGVDIIDTLHRGRGAYLGFMHLVLGPTSGGKTILAHQLVASLTSLGRRVAFLSTEEDLDTADETKSRIYAACTDITTDEWSAANNDPRRLAKKLSAENLERLRAVRSRTSFLSFDSAPSWGQIEARLAMMEEKNKAKFDAVLIDWAGPLAAEMQKAEKIKEPHDALERIAMMSQVYAKRSKSAVFLMHQLAMAESEKKGTFGIYSEGDSQNCKKMAQYSAATYIITPYVKGTMMLRFCGPKLRFDIKHSELVAQLDPTHSRINYCESHTVQGSRFVDKRKKGGGGDDDGTSMASVRRA